MRHGGAVIYLPQEGRGIGLANKVCAGNLVGQALSLSLSLSLSKP
jgi:GTP cyclohydrolase II